MVADVGLHSPNYSDDTLTDAAPTTADVQPMKRRQCLPDDEMDYFLLKTSSLILKNTINLKSVGELIERDNSFASYLHKKYPEISTVCKIERVRDLLRLYAKKDYKRKRAKKLLSLNIPFVKLERI